MTKLTQGQLFQIIEAARAKGDKAKLVGVNLKETELPRLTLDRAFDNNRLVTCLIAIS